MSSRVMEAGMVLAGVGDALGYRKGRWESCPSGPQIQEELASLGGLGALKLDPDNWPLSDGALMHMTTAEALITGEDRTHPRRELVRVYVEAMASLQGRPPDAATVEGCAHLKPDNFLLAWHTPFNEKGQRSQHADVRGLMVTWFSRVQFNLHMCSLSLCLPMWSLCVLLSLGVEVFNPGVFSSLQVYKRWSSEGRAGRRGHDAPMIAYDALLASGSDWTQVCRRAMFHGGESSATGLIAGCLYGLLFGLSQVPEGLHQDLDRRTRLEELGAELGPPVLISR
uniref:ADP-ribosylhydrolase like 1 n=1 Tax=Hucho hucho TaxID=62062 RepID=A0A4W5NF70_9TELE